jgi:hypothetical protein
MKKFIKKHLLTWLLKTYVFMIWFGVYVLVNPIAAAERGFNAIGIEDILFTLPLIVSTLRTFKKIITK